MKRAIVPKQNNLAFCIKTSLNNFIKSHALVMHFILKANGNIERNKDTQHDSDQS